MHARQILVRRIEAAVQGLPSRPAWWFRRDAPMPEDRVPAVALELASETVTETMRDPGGHRRLRSLAFRLVAVAHGEEEADALAGEIELALLGIESPGIEVLLEETVPGVTESGKRLFASRALAYTATYVTAPGRPDRIEE
jgi:hypothetical protein